MLVLSVETLKYYHKYQFSLFIKILLHSYTQYIYISSFPEEKTEQLIKNSTSW